MPDDRIQIVAHCYKSGQYVGVIIATADEIEAMGYQVGNAPVIDHMAAARSSAKIDKLDFCLALLRLEILPVDECKVAARGGWPATFAAYAQSLSAMEAAEAEVRWATVQAISYQSPLLQALALFKTNGDSAAATALLDAIFGISG